MNIAVVIPTYNEKDNIGALLDSLHDVFSSLPCQPHFLVVDDMSTDGTAVVVHERQLGNPGIHLLSGQRAGLGTAYVRGLRFALARFDPDVVIQMDADFSHSPDDIPRLLHAIASGADLAIGSRYSDGNRAPKEWGWKRHCLSWLGNLVARRWLQLLPVRDCTAGFRAWRADALREIDYATVMTQGYVFQVAMLQRALTQGARVIEVPVEFRDRIHGASKLGWADITEFARWAFINNPPFGRRQ